MKTSKRVYQGTQEKRMVKGAIRGGGGPRTLRPDDEMIRRLKSLKTMYREGKATAAISDNFWINSSG